MQPNLPLFAAALILSGLANPTTAADFTFGSGKDAGSIRLEGQIRKGDVQKLTDLIKSNPKRFLNARTIFLNSPGGSVEEAIGLAKLIEKSGLGAGLSDDDVCASSCFLIYSSASIRFSWGSVLVHRPYFNLDGVQPSQYESYSKMQRNSILALRSFLEERSVPGGIIDKMMSLPSNEAYLLTFQDLKSIGYLSPTIEEVSIIKCGVSNSNLLDPEKYMQNSICVYNNVTLPIRFSLVSSIVGDANASALFREIISEQQ